MLMTPETVVRLLAEPDRMRVLGAVALGAETADAVVAAAGLPARAALVALRRLQDQELLVTAGGSLRVDYGRLRELSRAATASIVDDAPDTGFRPFLRDGRLVRLPAQQSRRQALLAHLVDGSFEPGAAYPETAVNDRLRAWCEGGEVDHVTIRRYLVDLGLLSRADGIYTLGAEPTGAPGPGERHVRTMGLS